MTLKEGMPGQSYYIGSVEATEKNKSYLLSLGVFAGSTVTMITRTKYTYILSVKDGRYAIDQKLAEKISLIPSEKEISSDSSQTADCSPVEEMLQAQALLEARSKTLEAQKKTKEAHAETVEARKKTEQARTRTKEARENAKKETVPTEKEEVRS